jgi:hypothetical protein
MAEHIVEEKKILRFVNTKVNFRVETKNLVSMSEEIK